MNGEKLGSCSSHKLEPSTKVLVHFFLGDCSVQVRVFPSVPHLIEDIEVVLDVLQGAVFGEPVHNDSTYCFAVGILGLGLHGGFLGGAALQHCDRVAF
jgi:hypothetical protein